MIRFYYLGIDRDVKDVKHEWQIGNWTSLKRYSDDERLRSWSEANRKLGTELTTDVKGVMYRSEVVIDSRPLQEDSRAEQLNNSLIVDEAVIVR